MELSKRESQAKTLELASVVHAEKAIRTHAETQAHRLEALDKELEQQRSLAQKNGHLLSHTQSQLDGLSHQVSRLQGDLTAKIAAASEQENAANRLREELTSLSKK